MGRLRNSASFLKKALLAFSLLISSLVMAQSWSNRLIKLYPGVSMETNKEVPYSPEIDFGFNAERTQKKVRDFQLSLSLEFEDELPARPKINEFFAYTFSIQRMWGDLVLSLNLENMLQFSSEKILNEASLNSLDKGNSALILESETPYLFGLGIAFTF